MKHPILLGPADYCYIDFILWEAKGRPPLPLQHNAHIRSWLRHQGLCINCQKSPCAANCGIYKSKPANLSWTKEMAEELLLIGE